MLCGYRWAQCDPGEQTGEERRIALSIPTGARTIGSLILHAPRTPQPEFAPLNGRGAATSVPESFDKCVGNLYHTVSIDRVSRETGENDLLAVGFDLREAERPSLWV